MPKRKPNLRLVPPLPIQQVIDQQISTEIPDPKSIIRQLADLLNLTGAHEGHHHRQVGRCIYCSCGERIGQGKVNPKLTR